MLDIKLIRENPDYVKASLLKKEVDAGETIDRILALDKTRRELIAKTEADKAEQNKVSKQIPVMKKNGEDTAPVFARMNEIKEAIKAADAEIKTVEGEFNTLMLSLPNMPDDDLLAGGKENNVPLRYFGEPHKFDFEPKNHVDLCTDLGLIDYERGVKLAGSGFWLYRGFGSRLEWALLNYFIDTHIADGYELMLVPHMLEYQCGVTAGQFPKFADEVYRIANPTDDRIHYMLPTAEAALASVHRDEILSEADLPRKYISYTPCFRREAGSYRSDERGMVRGHQFNKVEMFQFTKPEDSDAAFEELVKKAETLVSGLGFHFRTVKLAAADCSASMARTYDIEIQIPSMNGYKEVSSVS
ncbi:MAG: serine--tRNA ligase, partial [Oscillospiraceae bacterium]|nr:serine--tRNA ligase [Oscillospiraceae bacterium]